MTALAQVDAMITRLRAKGMPAPKRDEIDRLLCEVSIALRPRVRRHDQPKPDLGPALCVIAALGHVGDPIALGRKIEPRAAPPRQRRLGQARLSELIAEGHVVYSGRLWRITALGAAAATLVRNDVGGRVQ